MGNLRSKSDDELMRIHDNSTSSTRYHAENELRSRGYENNGSGWEEETYIYDDDDDDEGSGILWLVGIVIAVIAVFIGLNYIHLLVGLAWEHTLLVSLIFAVGCLTMLSGKGFSKECNIFFFITCIPLATKFFPHIAGQDYMNWLLISDWQIDSFELAKYGLILLIYVFLACAITTFIASGLLKVYFSKSS